MANKLFKRKSVSVAASELTWKCVTFSGPYLVLSFIFCHQFPYFYFYWKCDTLFNVKESKGDAYSLCTVLRCREIKPRHREFYLLHAVCTVYKWKESNGRIVFLACSNSTWSLCSLLTDLKHGCPIIFLYGQTMELQGHTVFYMVTW